MKTLYLSQDELERIPYSTYIDGFLHEYKINIPINNDSNFRSLAKLIGLESALLNTFRKSLCHKLDSMNFDIDIISIRKIMHNDIILYYDTDFKVLSPVRL